MVFIWTCFYTSASCWIFPLPCLLMGFNVFYGVDFFYEYLFCSASFQHVGRFPNSFQCLWNKDGTLKNDLSNWLPFSTICINILFLLVFIDFFLWFLRWSIPYLLHRHLMTDYLFLYWLPICFVPFA